MATTITTRTNQVQPTFIPQQQAAQLGQGAKQTVTFNATETLVDCSLGGLFNLTLTATVTALTFINPLPGQTIVVEINQDGTGSRLVSSWTQTYFAGGTEPTLTTTAGAKDIFRFTWDDVTEKWYGQTVGLDFKA